MFRKIVSGVTKRLDHILASHGHTFEVSKQLLSRNLYLSGQIAAKQLRQIEQISTLADVEFRVTSQWGEDGIIEWLCLQLPSINRSFIEFGVENYGEANTRFLLQNRSWRGLIIDGNPSHINHVRTETLYWMNDIVAVDAFITAENINDIIVEQGFSGNIGLLSIDLDGVDYWVLESINCINPAILIVEVNGVFGDMHSITIPYSATFQRLAAHHSGQYFGASIKAICTLAESKGYKFIGTNSNGVNAFFIRNDLARTVLNAIKEVKIWPARHRDSRDKDGNLTFKRGIEKVDAIKELLVYDLSLEKIVPIESLFPLYSDTLFEDMLTCSPPPPPS